LPYDPGDETDYEPYLAPAVPALVPPPDEGMCADDASESQFPRGRLDALAGALRTALLCGKADPKVMRASARRHRAELDTICGEFSVMWGDYEAPT